MIPLVAILALVATLDTVRLRGDWLMVERHYPNGTVQKYPDGEQTTDHFNIYVKGNTATIHHDWTDPNDEVENTFSLNPARGQIDFVVTGSTIGGLKKGERQAGIYTFE